MYQCSIVVAKNLSYPKLCVYSIYSNVRCHANEPLAFIYHQLFIFFRFWENKSTKLQWTLLNLAYIWYVLTWKLLLIQIIRQKYLVRMWLYFCYFSKFSYICHYLLNYIHCTHIFLFEEGESSWVLSRKMMMLSIKNNLGGKVLKERDMVIRFTQPNCAFSLLIYFIIKHLELQYQNNTAMFLALDQASLFLPRPLILSCILFQFITSLGKKNHSS